MNLIVCNVAVSMNKDGMYSLNDFHKAAGGEEKDKPSLWIRGDKVKELIAEYSQSTDSSLAISVVKGGKNPGIYACEDLVYVYAAWISVKFQKLVFDTFKAAIHEEYQRRAIRENAREGYKDLSKALKEYKGEKIKWYHYANEADMINLIVLGCTAKDFRKTHNLKDNELLRDHLNKFQIETIEQLQRMDEQLINLDFNLKQRKEYLEKRFADLSKKLLKLLTA